jgi:hypothetical protein
MRDLSLHDGVDCGLNAKETPWHIAIVFSPIKLGVSLDLVSTSKALYCCITRKNSENEV